MRRRSAILVIVLLSTITSPISSLRRGCERSCWYIIHAHRLAPTVRDAHSRGEPQKAIAAVGLAKASPGVWRHPDLPFMWWVFGLMLGGAVGNLIDRLTQDGVVTDFVDLRWWPVFNIADSCLVIGALLLAVYTLFFEGQERCGPATDAHYRAENDAG